MRFLLVASLALAALAGPSLALADSPPPNDTIAGATPVVPDWIGLSGTHVVQTIVPASPNGWGAATTSSEDVKPSCLSTVGFRSLWYSVTVSEASELQVRVSDSTLRYQAVVTITDSTGNNEIACDVASPLKSDPAGALVRAYVTPLQGGQPQTYLIRVAEVNDAGPVAGQPSITVQTSGIDLTAPHILVSAPKQVMPPGQSVRYDASKSFDLESGVNWLTASWVVTDGGRRSTYGSFTNGTAREALNYTWKTPGTHTITLTLSDFAGNQQSYTFTVYIHDTTAPSVFFSLRAAPLPGSKRLSIKVIIKEPVRLRLFVTQGRRLLWNGPLTFLHSGSHNRIVHLHLAVARNTTIVTSGVARDFAGNTTVLPTCLANPTTGAGACIKPK